MESTKVRLHAILTQLQETEPLQSYDRGISQDEYDAWMKHFNAINQLVHDAEQAAMIELPIEISRLLGEVRKAAFALYPKPEGQKKSSDDDKPGISI